MLDQPFARQGYPVKGGKSILTINYIFESLKLKKNCFKMFNAKNKTFTGATIEPYIILFSNRSCYLENKMLVIVYKMKIGFHYIGYYIYGSERQALYFFFKQSHLL